MELYFSNLYSVLVVYEDETNSTLFHDYLFATEAAVSNVTSSTLIRVSWLKMTEYDELDSVLWDHIKTGCQGYVTIVQDLPLFLNAKYDISKKSIERIRDKRFLFLASNEITNPEDFFTIPALKRKL